MTGERDPDPSSGNGDPPEAPRDGSGNGDPPDLPGDGSGNGDPGAVALGDRPADLVVTGGRVLCPDGTFRERSVAVAGDRVAALVGDPDRVTGPDTRTVEASGRSVIPGLVDAHDHVDVHATVERRYHRRLARGTTAVVTEASSIAGAVGPGGVEALLAATDGLPLGVFVSLPPQGFVDTFEPADASDAERERLAGYLGHERVVGVGETGWIHVVGREASDLRAFYRRARAAGGRVVGHGAGCRGDDLAAFAGLVDNDHEPTAPEGVTERLAAGLHVVGRRGSIRDDLDAVAAADRPRGDVSLCTDGTWPGDDAGMDDVVRAAIDRGIPPAEAVELASRNPAAHFGLDDRGTIAPGNRADLVVVRDLPSVDVETVVAGGDVVVRDGDPVVDPRPYDYPDDVLDAVHVDVDSGTFRVPTGAGTDGAVRAIRSDEGLLTRETTVEPAVENGSFVADPDREILKAALLDRRPGRPEGFVGFVEGLGIDRGAVATSLTWEQPCVLAVGATDDALRAAVERLAGIDGGWVVVDGDPGEEPAPVAELSMPVAGVMADRPEDAVAAGYERVESALVGIGTGPDPGMPRASEGHPGPLLALQTLAFPGVPVCKLSRSGYAHVVRREVVGLSPGD